MEYINKTVFLNYLNCPALGWKTKKDMLPKLSGLNNELLTLEGRNIHKEALKLFPDTVSEKKLKLENPAASFKDLLADLEINKSVCAMSFVTDSFYAKPDILKKLEDNSWHLFEVKSGSRYKIKYTNNISFNVMVLSRLGIRIGKTSALYLSSDYHTGMDYSKLFTEVDCSKKVEIKSREFLSIADEASKDLQSEIMPPPVLKRHCKNCPIFDVCIGKDEKKHIFDLPRLSIVQMDQLIAMGVDTIDKVPNDFELTERQKMVKNCVLTDTRYVSNDLKSELENIKQPFYYLDFESVTTIMPLYPHISPHTQILTQFSLDKADESGNILKHYEYIADQTRDCRKDISEQLIEYLDKEGSIVTYANTECIIISKLALLFPELSENLNKIIERIVDLEFIIRKNYYDINFHGRTSIKKILPVLIPDMSYDSLDIREGGGASAAFAFMAMGLYDEVKIKETKNNLLKYCAQDTLAMIRIHQFLINATK
jgi:CRISPR/Cas system-associated exonuclease Cas4 (RecB family)